MRIRLAIVVALTASLATAGTASAVIAAGSAGDSITKAPPVTARYVLIVNFSGYARWEVPGTDGAAVDWSEEETIWAGRSKPFRLVNTGTRTRPRIEIRTASSGPFLTVDGFLEHRGRGESYSEVAGAACTRAFTASNGDARMSAVVVLAANRLRVRMDAAGKVAQAWTGCIADASGSCTGCLAIPERLGLSPDWWSRFPLEAKQIRFGRVFTIRRQRSSLVDAAPLTPPLTGYLFRWVLKFSPVKS